MAENRGVLVVGEVVEGRVALISLELLGIGRKLADGLGEGLSAVLMGSGLADLGKELVAHGADRVYVVDSPLLADYQTDSYTAVLEKLCRETEPSIVLMGQTSMGRDLAPRLAFRLGTGLAMDSIELGINPETRLLQALRPVYGGNALAVMVCENTKPQMATVRPKCTDPLERDDSRSGEIVAYDAGIDPSVLRVKVLDKVKEEVAGIKLEDAEVVVCGGRGMGGPENFPQLEELARLLGGALGATRPPCDSGWVPATIQIGLTGKIVTPNFYIGVALSGSSQHLAGCSGSKHMVAINRDPEANIFKFCQYGVVGDYKKVLPPFIQKVKELLAS